jgi:hypothetical protein
MAARAFSAGVFPHPMMSARPGSGAALGRASGLPAVVAQPASAQAAINAMLLSILIIGLRRRHTALSRIIIPLCLAMFAQARLSAEIKPSAACTVISQVFAVPAASARLGALA